MKSTQKMFYLHPDDIVFIPQRRLTKMAQVAEEISGILFFRGWGINLGHDWNTDLNN
jgi:hypothetical protein